MVWASHIRDRLLYPAGLHVAILASVALAIGIYLIVTSVTIASDGVFYINQARDLAVDPHGAAQRYPLGYPALLLAAHKVRGLFVESDSAEAWALSSQVVTLLCRVGALIFVYLLGRLLVGARRSFWAVLILVVLPLPARYGADVLREWPFLLFLSLGFWLLLKALRDKKWRLFGLVGLVSGLGYLIRPMCGQLVIYGLLALLVAHLSREPRGTLALLGAGLTLLLGFAIPVVPYLAWSGVAVPHQFRPTLSDSAPVIATVGDKPASGEPLSFDVQPGEVLDLAIEAFDPDGDALAFSAVSIPLGARPVYRLRSAEHRADFWTMDEKEKERLITSPHRMWDYQGIDYYAYPRSDGSDLQPVYRFWSPVLSRHFYTTSGSEAAAIGERTPADQWRREGVVFYVWPENGAPRRAAPVYRFRSQAGEYFWSLDDDGGAIERWAGVGVEAEGTVWWVHTPGQAPTGLTLDGKTLQWRPTAGQQGQHQLNIIVTDGELQTCQLIRVDVRASGPVKEANIERPAIEPLPSGPVTVRPVAEEKTVSTSPASPERDGLVMTLLGGLNAVFGGVSANLMGFFLLPLCVGFGYRLRYEADWQERVLMIGVVTVNAALIFGRYVWVEPTIARRYSVGLIALTIVYVPTGLEVLSRWSRILADRIFGDQGRAEFGERVWFCTLLAIGIAVCLPKLLRPLHADKAGYRDVAAWLRDHTAVSATVAVPDSRIIFYAERRGRVYRRQADPRTVDYVVMTMTGDDSSGDPEGWEQRYSCWIDRSRGTRWVVFRVR